MDCCDTPIIRPKQEATTTLAGKIRANQKLILVAVSGIFFLLGFAGTHLFDLPANIATLLYLCSLIAGGYTLATTAVPGLFRGEFDTDLLMLVAALGAVILGEWAEGAFLLFLFGLGHAGEQFALDKARDAVNALGEFMPATAHRLADGVLIETDVEQLQIGDVVVIRPGDRVPIDGEIIDGESSIDQSPITGESAPVFKTVGDSVFAGTINHDQALRAHVTHLAKDNTIARMMTLIASAQSEQSPTQQLAQRFSTKFVPGILLLVLLVIVAPPALGWMDWSASFYRGMLLLVAASPCALAIGTPASVLAGIGQGARNGALIKGGVHLENLGMVNAIAFDKTGTLTSGQFQVTDVLPCHNYNLHSLLTLAASVEQGSSHPLAETVTKQALDEGLALQSVESLVNLPGRGVSGVVAGKRILIGNWRLFAEQANHEKNPLVKDEMVQLEDAGKTVMAVSVDGEFAGIIALADTPRPQAKKMLADLRQLGVEHLIMLTGDNHKVAQRVGDELGITNIRAELLPEQKLTAIQELQRQYGRAAMIGDGINDAPALAAASVGIAMGGAGTAVALETADVALMGDDLSKLPFAVGLSRASRRNIVQNFGIAVGIIALLVVTSVFGWIELNGAVVFHEGSTIFVALNALRLLRYQL